MLPAAHRMRVSSDFAAVTRRGRRTRCGGLVVYLAAAAPGGAGRSDPSRIGLIVGKSVGGSVVRHQVSRRLRAQLADRLATLPGGCRLVVRALPSAATASSERIGHELDVALGTLIGGGRSGATASGRGPRPVRAEVPS